MEIVRMNKDGGDAILLMTTTRREENRSFSLNWLIKRQSHVLKHSKWDIRLLFAFFLRLIKNDKELLHLTCWLL